MWDAVRSFLIFVAAVAAFVLAVLEILKNHLGVDTHAMLLAFGNEVGTFLVLVQTVFGATLQRMAEWLVGSVEYSGTVILIFNLFVILVSIAAVYRSLRVMDQQKRHELAEAERIRGKREV